MIEVTETAEGCLLPISAQPSARKAGLFADRAGALRVAVNAAPEKGKANKAVIETLRAALGLKRSQLELVAGKTSRQKRVLIRGVTRLQLETQLSLLLDPK